MALCRLFTGRAVYSSVVCAQTKSNVTVATVNRGDVMFLLVSA